MERARELLDEFDPNLHPMVRGRDTPVQTGLILQTTFKTGNDHVGDDYFINSNDKVRGAVGVKAVTDAWDRYDTFWNQAPYRPLSQAHQTLQDYSYHPRNPSIRSAMLLPLLILCFVNIHSRMGG